MRRYTRLMMLALLVFLSSASANAGAVLMIGPNPNGLFSEGGLAQYGHTVTIGPNYDVFNELIDLSPYDVIILSAADYQLPPTSESGQQAIADFVANGGGLITGEWTTWKNNFNILKPLFPTTTDGSYIGGAGVEISVRYAQVTPDPIMNAGLPAVMDFVVNGSGSEIIVPKAGSTVFYSGDSISPYYLYDEFGVPYPVEGVFPSAGLVGWNYGLGRVMNFSTTLQQPVGPGYTDNYSRLVANAIDWAGAGSPQAVPEPGSLTLFLALGGISVMGARLRRRGS